MNIGILTIGDELTGGLIRNDNAAWIASRLTLMGWNIAAVLTVPDREDAIRQALDFFPPHCGALLITGGLGPTADDITTATIAKACGRQLVVSQTVLNALRKRIKDRGGRWSSGYARQALYPEGARLIPNHLGSAWGFSCSYQECLLIALPGVPEEARRMVAYQVIPLLEQHAPGKPQAVRITTLKCFGLAEIEIETKIRDLIPPSGPVRIGYYPRFPEVHLVLSARHRHAEKAEASLASVLDAVQAALDPFLFACDEETLAGVVGKLLTQKGISLAIAESCTGGLIADLLTDISGSSRYFERSVVTYSNVSKTQILHVPEAVLADHGAVSEPTARRMAEGIRQAAGTTLGLSTTGIAGPTGAVPGKPVGTVYIALAGPDGTICRHCHFHQDRRRVKIAAAYTALMMLRAYLLASPSETLYSLHEDNKDDHISDDPGLPGH